GRFRDHAYSAPVEIQLRRSHYTLRDHRGKTASFSASHPLRIEARRGALKLDGAEYPGAFVLHLSQSAATFDVVEHVYVEDYLPGVLTRELYPGWADAAYEAQAVAARSYAMHERQRRLASGDYFDVESTTQDQAYGGANA